MGLFGKSKEEKNKEDLIQEEIQNIIRAKKENIQKWEYLFVNVELAERFWRVRHINGNELKNWKEGLPFIDFLNQVGEQGWELVAYDRYAASEDRFQLFMFKRLK